MNEMSNGKMVKGCFKVSILIKTDILQNVSLPIMSNWSSRTIPMSKYFSGSRPLRHNEVRLYLEFCVITLLQNQYFTLQ